MDIIILIIVGIVILPFILYGVFMMSVLLFGIWVSITSEMLKLILSKDTYIRLALSIINIRIIREHDKLFEFFTSFIKGLRFKYSGIILELQKCKDGKYVYYREIKDDKENEHEK